MKNKTILFALQFSLIMFIIKSFIQILGYVHESYCPVYNFETAFSSNLCLSWGAIILATMSIMCFPIFTKLVFDRLNNIVYIKYIFPVKKDKILTTMDDLKEVYCDAKVWHDIPRWLINGPGCWWYRYRIIVLLKPNSPKIEEYRFRYNVEGIRKKVIDKINDFLHDNNQPKLEIPLISYKFEEWILPLFCFALIFMLSVFKLQYI